MGVKEKRGVERAERVLHDKHTNITAIEFQVAIEVESVGHGRQRQRRCSRQWKYLIVPMKVERLRVGKEETPSVDILLDRVKRGNRSGCLPVVRFLTIPRRPSSYTEKLPQHTGGGWRTCHKRLCCGRETVMLVRLRTSAGQAASSGMNRAICAHNLQTRCHEGGLADENEPGRAPG